MAFKKIHKDAKLKIIFRGPFFGFYLAIAPYSPKTALASH